MERVKFTYRVFDNCLEITPVDKIYDNSVYKLTLKNIKSVNKNKILDKAVLEITTAMKPAYCNVNSIKTLVDVFDVPESSILYQIRQASREADFIYAETFDGAKIPLDNDGNPPFPVEKFTEVRASQFALTKAYITGTSEAGLEGTLGKITFKNGDELTNINKLITDLKSEAKKWQDAMRCYSLPGRNKPSFALRGNWSWRATPASVILNDYTRSGNMGIHGAVRI